VQSDYDFLKISKGCHLEIGGTILVWLVFELRPRNEVNNICFKFHWDTIRFMRVIVLSDTHMGYMPLVMQTPSCSLMTQT